MNVEIELAKRMLFRSSPIYVIVPVLFYFKSQEAFFTSLYSSVIVATGFFLGAVTVSYTHLTLPTKRIV